MGVFTAVIGLFSNGVGGQKTPPDCSSVGEGEPKSTILVIDDDPAVLLTVKTLLVNRGFNVLTSSSAPKGLDMLRYGVHDIRIVVLDFYMPKLNGGETLNYIKQLSPNAKVIGLTAVKFDMLPSGYIDGVDELLSKPVVADTLFDAIDKVLVDEETVSAAIQS